MTLADGLVIEPLGKRHERAAFSCGIPELDRYLARQAGQHVRRRIARVFVCRRGGADSVIGYYTLSALLIELMSLPDRLSRRLPRHPVPCALIGRLANRLDHFHRFRPRKPGGTGPLTQRSVCIRQAYRREKSHRGDEQEPVSSWTTAQVWHALKIATGCAAGESARILKPATDSTSFWTTSPP